MNRSKWLTSIGIVGMFVVLSLLVVNMGKNYRAVAVIEQNIVNTVTTDRVAIPTEIESRMKQRVLLEQDLRKIQNWFENNQIDYGGIYVDENGNLVVLLTNPSSRLEENIRKISLDPQKVTFGYVKYSLKELLDTQKKIAVLQNELSISLLAVNVKQNKIDVIIMPELFETSKTELLKYVNEDIIRWRQVRMRNVDQ